MLTPTERRQIREVMKQLDAVYTVLAKLAQVQGQEPRGWMGDVEADDGVQYWEGLPKRET
jgi:hypothetical protein